jgi:hypothetical protein
MIPVGIKIPKIELMFVMNALIKVINIYII